MSKSYILRRKWEVIDARKSWVGRLAFSNDGLLALGYYGGPVAVFNPDDGTELCKMRADGQDFIRSLCYSPDFQWLAAAGLGGQVFLWKAGCDGSLFRTFCGHSDAVNSISFSPDSSRLVSASNDKTLRIWDLKNPADDQKGLILRGHECYVQCVSWSPLGSRVASSSVDSTVRIWDLDTEATSKKADNETEVKAREDLVLGHNHPIQVVRFSQDGKLLASGSEDGSICMWDGETGRHLRSLEGHNNVILWLFFSPDGRSLGSTGYRDVIIWATTTGKQVHHFGNDETWTWRVTFSNDGQLQASASDDRVVRL
ncbi:WD40-repeat-containing domain protein [Xylaria intraflava]|nr:WD40-repeat-containing domain protein [Xylaria intraflava]